MGPGSKSTRDDGVEAECGEDAPQKKCPCSHRKRQGRSVSLREERWGQLEKKMRSAENVFCGLDGTLEALTAHIDH